MASGRGATRTLMSDARVGLSVCSVDWRLHRDRRLAVTVEKLRRWIESVRPDDRACLLIDARLAEVLGIAQWLAQRPTQHKRAVDVAGDAIVKDDSETVVIERLHVCDLKHDLHFRAVARPEPAAQPAERAPSSPRARRCATAPTGVRGATRAAEASRPAREVCRARSGRRPRRTRRGSSRFRRRLTKRQRREAQPRRLLTSEGKRRGRSWCLSTLADGLPGQCESWYASVCDRHRWPVSDGRAPQREDTADQPEDGR